MARRPTNENVVQYVGGPHPWVAIPWPAAGGLWAGIGRSLDQSTVRIMFGMLKVKLANVRPPVLPYGEFDR